MKRKLHINALGLLTIVVALKLWGKLLRGKKVLIFCDNMSSCNVINKGLSRDDFHQSCLREICFVAVTNEFTLKAQHTSGQDNRIADILSRWNWSRNSQKKLDIALGNRHCERMIVDRRKLLRN